MNIDDSETNEKRYTLRPTFTPLPSKRNANGANTESGTTATESEPLPAGKPNRNCPATPAGTGKAKANSLIRAANEDDDLYDPYSDYHDGTLKAAEFEEDPWR